MLNPDCVVVNGLQFKKYIDKEKIAARVGELGKVLSEEYEGKTPVVLGVLNGAMLFMSDLIRACSFQMQCRFLRTSSYQGLESSGKLRVENPEVLKLEGQDVIVVEDIVDSGVTMHGILEFLSANHPKSIKVVTFLWKPEAAKVKVQVDLSAFVIPNEFVLGYGLDYDGLGRNYPDLYQIADNQ